MPLSNTIRADGSALSPTVASVIAVGSGSCACIASASHSSNWMTGLASTSVSFSAARWYSRRRSAVFIAGSSDPCFIIDDLALGRYQGHRRWPWWLTLLLPRGLLARQPEQAFRTLFPVHSRDGGASGAR